MPDTTKTDAAPQATTELCVALATDATIGRRMIHVTHGAGRVVKNKQMEGGKQKYKYVSHDQVVEAVSELMCEAGIVMQQRILETTTELQEIDGQYGKRSQMFTTMKMEFDFCNADDMDDKVTVQSLGHGIDNGDKSPGKAMSYCKKYAILQGFMLSTGDDPDHDQETQQGRPRGSGTSHREQRQQQTQKANTAQKDNGANSTPAAQASVDWDKVCKTRYTQCADCGVKEDAAAIWKANAGNPQQLAAKLKELYDQANTILNGASDDASDPPF